MDQNTNASESNRFDLKGLLKACIKYWWIFLISLVCFIGLGLLFLYVKSPTYAIHGAVAVNENQEDATSTPMEGMLASFIMGGNGSKSAEDEMFKIFTVTNIAETVKKTGATIIYRRKDHLLAPSTWYYKDEPIKVSIPEQVLDTISASTNLKVKISNNGKDIQVTGKQGTNKLEKRVYHNFPFLYKTPLATFNIDRTAFFKPDEDMTVQVSICNPVARAQDMEADLSGSELSKRSNVFKIYMESPNPKFACDFLTALVDNYNDISIDRTQKFAQATVDFIDQRLVDLYKEINATDANVEQYKKSNELVDVSAEGEYLYSQKGLHESQLLEQRTRYAILQLVLDFLRSDSNKYSLVPFTETVSEGNLNEYNTLINQRMTMLHNSKANTSQIEDLTNRIDAMRANLISSYERILQNTGVAINDLSKSVSSKNSRLSEVPTLQRTLTSLYRDNAGKNQIYRYLLQKREESALTCYRSTAPGTIIDNPYSELKPKNPKPLIVIGLCFAAGLFIPAFGVSRGWFAARKNEEEIEENL